MIQAPTGVYDPRRWALELMQHAQTDPAFMEIRKQAVEPACAFAAMADTLYHTQAQTGHDNERIYNSVVELLISLYHLAYQEGQRARQEATP